jgi:hypothetical protein
MPYPALPDRRMPWDIDGTIAYTGDIGSGAYRVLSSGAMVELNDDDHIAISGHGTPAGGTSSLGYIWLFFPEQREVTGYYFRCGVTSSLTGAPQGSNDTTNGLDGTWETASIPQGAPAQVNDFSWRDGIKAISFTGPKKNIRHSYSGGSSNTTGHPAIAHYYGEAAAGQMAHDLEFINHDDTPGVAFTAPEDFGDQPLGTTVVRQFRIKNTSATRTATNLNIQLNDAEFVIAENPAGPWVVTINLASLGPGAESPTYYIRLTTPAPGENLDPHAARIITVCDAGFFG